MHVPVETARTEAQKQVDSGLIQGGVIASTRSDEIIVVGRQCVKPVARTSRTGDWQAASGGRNRVIEALFGH